MGTLVFPSMTLDPMPSPHGQPATWPSGKFLSKPGRHSAFRGLLWLELRIPCLPAASVIFLWSRDFSASWRMYLLGEPVRHRLHMSLRAFLRAFRSFSLCRGLQSMRAYGRVFSNLDA